MHTERGYRTSYHQMGTINVNVISVDADDDDEVVPLSFDCRAFRLQVRKPSDSLMKDVGEAMRSEDR